MALAIAGWAIGRHLVSFGVSDPEAVAQAWVEWAVDLPSRIKEIRFPAIDNHTLAEVVKQDEARLATLHMPPEPTQNDKDFRTAFGAG